jgi:hypothetical protein
LAAAQDRTNSSTDVAVLRTAAVEGEAIPVGVVEATTATVPEGGEAPTITARIRTTPPVPIRAMER